MKSLHTIRGKVKTGAGRGAVLGYPTANVGLQQEIPEGIYASEVKVGNRLYKAATFVGSAKTFGEKNYKLEAHILDFSDNIYGQQVTVKLFKKIRENKKFKSAKELINQIKKDIWDVKSFFKQKG